LSRIVLAIILTAYAAFGGLYAVNTPRWQAPDEPAHFNYVRFVAENGAFPVLQAGDYDQAYLEKIKAAKFPDALSIDLIRYESHQPPLYYLLAAPVYLAAQPFGLNAVVLALRLFSVALGVVVLGLAYAILREVFPKDDVLVLASVGLTATVPMHMAMSSAINNDTFAEVILALILLVSVRRVLGKVSDRQFVVWGGILFGLALLTKTTIYVPGAGVLLVAQVKSEKLKVKSWGRVGALFGIAVLVAGAWFVRNAMVYGPTDLLGWVRHDAVVVGQPTTAECVARYGLKDVVADFFIVTFKSFWAQFGWMGVLVNDRIYVGLFGLTGVALAGLALWVAKVGRERGDTPQAPRFSAQWWNLGLLALVLVTVLAEHAAYNLKFVQPQGRYLFPALIPIAAFFIIGLRELLNREHERVVFGALYLALLALDWMALFWFIVPQLKG
jgi:hypothetical protein